MAIVAMIICLIIFFLVISNIMKPFKIKIPKDIDSILFDFGWTPIIGVLILLITQTITWDEVDYFFLKKKLIN